VDKVHSTTRPAWALGSLEGVFAFLLALAVIGVSELTTCLKTSFLKSYAERTVGNLVDVATLVVIPLICFAGFWFYGKIKKNDYPGSYLYCFLRTDDHGQKTPVLGHFVLECQNDGSMFASGASFDWRHNNLEMESKVGWKSEHVGAKKANREATCFVLYEVNPEDVHKRNYRHGLLTFTAKAGEKGVVSQGRVYRGAMQGVDPEGSVLKVHAKAYAERIGKNTEERFSLQQMHSFAGRLIQCLEER
jgi:hypothetical protein